VTHQGEHIKTDTSKGDTSSVQVFKCSSNQVFKDIGIGAMTRTRYLEKQQTEKKSKTSSHGTASTNEEGQQGIGGVYPWRALPRTPLHQPFSIFCTRFNRNQGISQ
jgi:hypothetical protein